MTDSVPLPEQKLTDLKNYSQKQIRTQTNFCLFYCNKTAIVISTDPLKIELLNIPVNPFGCLPVS